MSDLSAPGEPSAPIPTDFSLSDYVDGRSSVISHMAPGTYYMGGDGVVYQHLGDTYGGKSGKVKMARTLNLKTGHEKNTPYFAVHGIEYTTLVPKGGEASPGLPSVAKFQVAAMPVPDDAKKKTRAKMAKLRKRLGMNPDLSQPGGMPGGGFSSRRRHRLSLRLAGSSVAGRRCR